MDQPPTVDSPSPASPPPLPPTTSLAARLLNVFATPGEVFEEVAATPHAAKNWLIPALISCAVMITSVVILFSQPAMQQKIREQQQAAMDKNVAAGKMTQADADKAMALISKFTAVMAGIGGLFWAIAGIFLWAFGLWLLGLAVLKTNLSYMKLVEVVSLAGMISVLHEVVLLLMRINLGNPSSTTSLALVVGEMDPQNPLHMVLAMLDLFVIWYLIVLSVGVSKLARVRLSRVLFVITFCWLVFRLLLIAGAALTAKMFT